MDKPGRNDPCTCGSGKKFKKCCGSGNLPIDPALFEALENPALRTAYEAFTESRRMAGSDDIPTFMERQGTPNAASGPSRDLQKAMAGKEFKNQADMMAFADQWNEIQNNRARDEFLGLSAAQMYLVFHGSPEEQEALALLDFPAVASDTSGSVMVEYTGWLLGLLAKGPVKLTPAGYLPPGSGSRPSPQRLRIWVLTLPLHRVREPGFLTMSCLSNPLPGMDLNTIFGSWA